MAQPFIENAIEHGLGHMNDKGKIDIRFSLDRQKLLLEIEDNGIGIQKSKQIGKDSMSNHHPIATAITRDRVELFNKKNRNKIDFEIAELKKENNEIRGTLVSFLIPIEMLK